MKNLLDNSSIGKYFCKVMLVVPAKLVTSPTIKKTLCQKDLIFMTA